MHYLSTHNRTVGINFTNNSYPSINVWAPYARSVAIEINGKSNYKLEKAQFGYWQSFCQDIKPGDRYIIKLNNKNSFPDPASLSQPDGVHKASECIDLNEIKNIKAEKWNGIPLKELIIYELHVGTFTQQGTFKAIHSKLDYLKKLGINAIELMPVAQFSGNRNWGYDGVFPFAVQHSYGGPKELVKLVKACHEHGIAVILDVVFNHLGPEGNYLPHFAQYLSKNYKTPWGNAINFDDEWCDGVRHFYIENALMWLRDFDIDGLRVDAVQAIIDTSPVHFLRELTQNIKKLNKQNNKNHFLIAESDLNDTRYINSLETDGYGLDSQWCDDFHHALHSLITGEKMSYYSDFGNIRHLVKSYNKAYVYDGNYSEHRKKFFGTPTTNQPGDKFVVYTQNHDQVGNRLYGERLSSHVDFETLKLAAGAMFVSPFLNMIFMGEEYGEDSPFLYFTEHENERLAERIKKKRKIEYQEFFKKNIQPPDPQSEETFLKSKLKWDYDKNNQKKLLLAYYKKCIQLKKNIDVLKTGKRHNTYARESSDRNAIVLNRSYNKNFLIAIMNFSDFSVKENLPEITNKKMKLLLYSAQKKWGGNVDNNERIIKQNNSIPYFAINPKSIAILTTQM